MGPNLTHRGANGSKYHLLTDALGVPLTLLLAGSNTYDRVLFEPLL